MKKFEKMTNKEKLAEAHKFCFEFMYSVDDCGSSEVQEFAEVDSDWSSKVEQDENYIFKMKCFLKDHYNHKKCYG